MCGYIQEKGRKLFEEIKPQVVFKPVEPDTALKFNVSAVKSVEVPQKRQYFFEARNNADLEAHIKAYKGKGRRQTDKLCPKGKEETEPLILLCTGDNVN